MQDRVRMYFGGNYDPTWWWPKDGESDKEHFDRLIKRGVPLDSADYIVKNKNSVYVGMRGLCSQEDLLLGVCDPEEEAEKEARLHQARITAERTAEIDANIEETQDIIAEIEKIKNEAGEQGGQKTDVEEFVALAESTMKELNSRLSVIKSEQDKRQQNAAEQKAAPPVMGNRQGSSKRAAQGNESKKRNKTGSKTRVQPSVEDDSRPSGEEGSPTASGTANQYLNGTSESNENHENREEQNVRPQDQEEVILFDSALKNNRGEDFVSNPLAKKGLDSFFNPEWKQPVEGSELQKYLPEMERRSINEQNLFNARNEDDAASVLMDSHAKAKRAEQKQGEKLFNSTTESLEEVLFKDGFVITSAGENEIDPRSKEDVRELDAARQEAFKGISLSDTDVIAMLKSAVLNGATKVVAILEVIDRLNNAVAIEYYDIGKKLKGLPTDVQKNLVKNFSWDGLLEASEHFGKGDNSSIVKGALGEAYEGSRTIRAEGKLPLNQKLSDKAMYIDQREVKGLSVIEGEELKKQLGEHLRKHPEDASKVKQMMNVIDGAGGERVLVEGGKPIPAGAAHTAENFVKPKGVTYRILGFFGLADTGYSLGKAWNQSVKEKSIRPFVAEGIRQAGSFAGSTGGGAAVRLVGGSVGAVGVLAITAVFNLLGGTAGYISADYIADQIYKN